MTYWGLNDPLTISTVFPHLKILSKFEHVDKIILVTIERPEESDIYHEHDLEVPKVRHIPLKSKNFPISKLNKTFDFSYFPKQYAKIAEENEVDLMICRGAMIGALGYLTNKRTGIPFYVESFEPHGDYMIESGVWSKHGIRNRFQQKWEKREMDYASGIMPVSYNYAKEITEKGVDEQKVRVIPCCVNMDNFGFSQEARDSIREELGIEKDQVAGIYVGKFGGMYFDTEAFDIFSKAYDYFGDRFRLIILTPNPAQEVRENLMRAGIPSDRVFVDIKPHADVPNYLSAADFAYALYKPSPSKQYLSPVKVGEYLGNGLPVMITDGVGDDHIYLPEEQAGVTFKYPDADFEKYFGQMDKLVSEENIRERIREVAQKHRSFEIARNVYSYFFAA